MNEFQSAIQFAQKKLSNMLNPYTIIDSLSFNHQLNKKFSDIMGDALIMDDRLDILQSVSDGMQELSENITAMTLGNLNSGDYTDLITSVIVNEVWTKLLNDEFDLISDDEY